MGLVLIKGGGLFPCMSQTRRTWKIAFEIVTATSLLFVLFVVSCQLFLK